MCEHICTFEVLGEHSGMCKAISLAAHPQLDAQAAGAVPLGGSAAGSPGSAAGQQATQPSPASGSTATATVPQRNVRRRIDPSGSTATASSSDVPYF